MKRRRKSECRVTNNWRENAEERISAGSARCLHPLTQIPTDGTTGPKIGNTKDSKYNAKLQALVCDRGRWRKAVLGVWYNAPVLSSNTISLGAYNSKALITKIHQPLTSTLTPLHTYAGTHAWHAHNNYYIAGEKKINQEVLRTVITILVLKCKDRRSVK